MLDNKYGIVISNYVFNTIKTLYEHKYTLNQIKQLSNNVHISVRNDIKSIKENWIYDCKNNTYYTGRSYQRFYTSKELEEYFENIEILTYNSKYILFKLL